MLSGARDTSAQKRPAIKEKKRKTVATTGKMQKSKIRFLFDFLKTLFSTFFDFFKEKADKLYDDNFRHTISCAFCGKSTFTKKIKHMYFVKKSYKIASNSAGKGNKTEKLCLQSVTLSNILNITSGAKWCKMV